MFTDNVFLFVTKIILSIFISILVPVYWKWYGPQNFLWLSDIGLFLTLISLWLESPLLMSITALTISPVELLWNIDFFTTNRIPFGIANYMFEPQYTWYLKALSLFHIFMPIIWFWFLYTHGYDSQAITYAIPLGWLVLLLSYLFTDPEKNINWVFMPEVFNWRKITPLVWLAIQMILVPIILWPLHLLFSWLF